MPLPIAPTPPDVSPEIAALLRDAREAASLDGGLVIVRQALAVAAAGSQRDRAAVGHAACFFLFRTGAIEEVIALGETVLPLLKAEALHTAYAEGLRWVGLCACDAGRFGTAIQYATEGYRLADELDDQRGRVLAFSLLGGCFERAGDPWQGERLLRDGLTLARELGEPYPLLATLNNLAAILIGKFYSLRDGWAADEARAALVDAVPLAREVLRLTPALNDPYFEAFARGNLGELLVHAGEFYEAEALLQTALKLAEASGYQAVSQRVRCSIAELHLARGQTQHAKQALENLLKEEATPPPVSTKLRLHYALYLAHRSEGNTAAALDALEAFRRLESQRSMQQLKDKSELMVTRLEADENQRKVLERAYSVAQVHATRAVELERMALQDDLTGLGNRRALDLRLAEMVDVARDAGSPLVVVVLDLDHFKRVNDIFGHAVGDRVLVQVAKLLQDNTRPADVVTRTGGEEFVIVMPGIGAPDAFDVCERLRLRISGFQWGAVAPELSVTLSGGIACAPEFDTKRLVERADLAMYRAKRAGRNRVAVAP